MRFVSEFVFVRCFSVLCVCVCVCEVYECCLYEYVSLVVIYIIDSGF